jgi:hypothetical protein
MLRETTAAEDELRDRIECQRRVITTQAEILESLGFDVLDIADCPERLQAPSKERLRLLLVGWLAPSPVLVVWVLWGVVHPAHGVYEAVTFLMP